MSGKIYGKITETNLSGIKLNSLFKRLKDSRNMHSLCALTNVLEEIAKYQKWAQNEKSSAFERKYQRNKLERKLNSKNDEQKIKAFVEEKLEYMDFENSKMKNSEIEMSYAQNKEETIQTILNKQTQISECFIAAKKEIHDKEDPKFLDSLSDVFDIRLWNLYAFRPEMEEDDELKDKIIDEENPSEIETPFQKEVKSFIEKLSDEKAKPFVSEFDIEKVISELDDILNILHQNEAENPGNLKLAAKEEHIVDQWKVIARYNTSIDEDGEHYYFFRLVKRAVLAADSQSGCERGNSTYNLFKNEISSTMQLPMISARL